jgi:integrase
MYASRSFWFNPVRGAAIALGVAPFKPHDLRRTLRTGLSRLRVPFEVREAVIGHSAKGLVRVYDRYDLLPEKASALAAWAAHVETVVSGEPRRAQVVPLVKP